MSLTQLAAPQGMCDLWYPRLQMPAFEVRVCNRCEDARPPARSPVSDEGCSPGGYRAVVSEEASRPGEPHTGKAHVLSPSQEAALFAQFQLPGFNYHILPVIYETLASKRGSRQLDQQEARRAEVARERQDEQVRGEHARGEQAQGEQSYGERAHTDAVNTDTPGSMAGVLGALRQRDGHRAGQQEVGVSGCVSHIPFIDAQGNVRAAAPSPRDVAKRRRRGGSHGGRIPVRGILKGDADHPASTTSLSVGADVASLFAFSGSLGRVQSR
jgi:hypothetical protein